MYRFLNFYNLRRKNITTNKIPTEIFSKYDDPTIRKEDMMATEQFRKRHLKQIDFEKEKSFTYKLVTPKLKKKGRIIVEKKTFKEGKTLQKRGDSISRQILR